MIGWKKTTVFLKRQADWSYKRMLVTELFHPFRDV